jgi:hypothetical protein
MEISQKNEVLILPGFFQVSFNPFQATDEVRRYKGSNDEEKINSCPTFQDYDFEAV